MDTAKTVEYIVETLAKKGLTIATAESCTGGMAASTIIDYPGASSVFMNGIVSYSNAAKMKFLGVKAETLEKYGAVSSETAKEMCEGTAKVSGTDIGISTTGVAGPGGGTPDKPVGTVWIGIHTPKGTVTKLLQLSGTRSEIRKQTTEILLEELKNRI